MPPRPFLVVVVWFVSEEACYGIAAVDIIKRPRAFRLWPLLSLTNLIFSFPAFFRIHSS